MKADVDRETLDDMDCSAGSRSGRPELPEDAPDGISELKLLVEATASAADPSDRRLALSDSRRHGWTLALAASAVLLLSAAAVLIASRDFVMLIGDTTIWRAPTVALCPWAAAVLILLVLTGTTLGRYRGRQRAPVPELLTVVGLLLAIFAAGFWTIGAAVLSAGADTVDEARLTALPASKALACAVVSEETSTVQTSSVRLYPIGRFGIGTPTLPTTYNSREFPIASGQYTQIPFPNGGILRLRQQSPSELQSLPFRCPQS